MPKRCSSQLLCDAMRSRQNMDQVCLVLERVPEDVFEPEFVADVPLVRFEAYADECRVFGWLRLRAERLTDLLNGLEELRLMHAEVESLVDGQTQAVDDVLVQRHQLVAVHASGPRGDESQRRRTRTHAVAVQAGNYLIGGYVHTLPGVDALASVRERPPMIPLTDAWVEYWSGGQRKRHWVGTILVNRDQADWIRLVSADDLAYGRMRPTASGT
jgi:hypothetical protein